MEVTASQLNPFNVMHIKFMADLWLSRQVFWRSDAVLYGKWALTFRDNHGGLVEYVPKKRQEPAMWRHSPL